MKAVLEHKPNFKKITGNDLELRIVCADDYYYNIEALRLVFSRLGLVKFCHFCNAGKDLVEYLSNRTTEYCQQAEPSVREIPIVIVDFEMPHLDGLETIKELKAMYNIKNFGISNGHE